MPRIRSGYSFRTAFGHLKDVASRLKEIGWERQPITDTANTYAFVKWKKMVPSPMFGVELGVTADRAAKKPAVDHWAFFAITRMIDLHNVIETATTESAREPLLTYKEATAAKGVVKIAGARALLEHVSPKTKDLYVALSPSMPIGLYREARKRGFKFIASGDNFYPRAEDLEAYRLALWRNAGTQTYPQHILSDIEWRAAITRSLRGEVSPAEFSAALANRAKVFKACVAKLEKASLFSPEKPKTLRKMCEEGAKKKKINLKDPVYAARLTRELDLIAEKKFEDYFYIIADIIAYAKQHMIVGPARGSSCGSLVCYLLDITTVDPIPYGLVFERFIDINRSDLPDIDIDFSDKRRDLAFKYVEKKYGRERVARLGTVGRFLPRSALNAAGAAFRIPPAMIGQVLDSLIVRSSGDARALQQLEDTLNDTEAGRALVERYPSIKMAGKLEGHPTNSSQHAAGMVVTSEAIQNYVAIDHRTHSAMCDKRDAEELNLLKIDMLGLTQLSVFERTLELIGKPFRGFLESLPLDDQAAFDILNARRYSGIFQFNGPALQSLAKQIQIDRLEDIIALTALARPGPLASGGANSWALRRTGKEEVRFPHKAFEPYLKNDLGIVIYQETVMRIGREVGDLSWDDVTQLRKSMSKSLGKEYFDQFGDRWKVGARKKGVPNEVLDKFWDELCQMGSWSFNRSHAVAYGLVSYYCCWLKAHHPLEFAAATLDAEATPVRQISILRELHNEGVSYKPVDIDFSLPNQWAIRRSEEDGKEMLVGPLTGIKGVGEAYAQEIMECREKGTPFRGALAKRIENGKTPVDSIWPIRDAINKRYPGGLIDAGIRRVPTEVVNIQAGSTQGLVLIVGVATRIAPRDMNDPQNVARRGYALKGATMTLNMFVRDDSDEIFCKIDRTMYEKMARPVIERGRVGKAIYAILGDCPEDFRMLKVRNIQYLGDLDDLDLIEPEPEEAPPTSEEEKEAA